MTQIHCKRCEAPGDGLGTAPLPGPQGDLVLAHTCRSCWEVWRGEQVKLINEHKLSPADPKHYEFLVERMRGFLKLG